MLTAKHILLTHLAESFQGRRDMSLIGVLEGLTEAEAAWRPAPLAPSIAEMLRHIAWSATTYCRDAFRVPLVADDTGVSPEGDTDGIPWEFPCGSGYGRTTHPGLSGATTLARLAQAQLVECLTNLPDDALDQPVANRHGRSAAHFFWVMTQHNLYHAGQIRTRRTAFQALPR
jgi:hypothetical protein